MSNHTIKDFTKGNIMHQIWSLSWPTMMTIFFYTLYNIVDTFWVWKLSVESIAAVSISQITLFVMLSLSMWVSVGSSVIMSMNLGAKDKKEAERVMAQSFVLATLMGIFFTILSLVFRENFLKASWAIGGIYEPALAYFTISAVGSLLTFYLINIMFAFNSEGDTFTLTKLFTISTWVNVILDPIFIFWKLWFPALWIQGAAYATLISQMIFIVLAMRVLSSEKRGVRFSFSKLSLQWESVKKVFKIGFPASLTQVLNPIWLAMLILIVSLAFRETGATAFSLVFRLEFFAYLPAVGFSMAAMSMIAQNIWSHKPKRAVKIFKKANIMWVVSALILGILLMIFWKYILMLFTQDEQVLQYSLWYVWIVAFSYWAIAVTMIVASSFQAMGKSWPGFWLMFGKFFFFAIPLSYILTNVYELPIWWVWGVVALSNFLTAIIWYFWVLWKLKKYVKDTASMDDAISANSYT